MKPAETPAALLMPAALLAGAALAACVLLAVLIRLPIELAERIWLFVLLFPFLWALASSGLLLARSRRTWVLAVVSGAAAAAIVALSPPA